TVFIGSSRMLKCVKSSALHPPQAEAISDPCVDGASDHIEDVMLVCEQGGKRDHHINKEPQPAELWIPPAVKEGKDCGHVDVRAGECRVIPVNGLQEEQGLREEVGAG